MWDRGSYCRRAKGKGTSYRGSAPSLPASTPPEHVPVQGRSHFTMVARFLISPNSLGATTDLHHHTTRAARSLARHGKHLNWGNPSSFAMPPTGHSRSPQPSHFAAMHIKG